MVDARSQQIASAPHDAVHRVAPFQKQFGQIRAVLTGDPGNQGEFLGIFHRCQGKPISGQCQPSRAAVLFRRSNAISKLTSSRSRELYRE